MKSATVDIDVFPIQGFRELVNGFTHLLAVVHFTILSFDLAFMGRECLFRAESSGGGYRVFLHFLLSMSTVYHMMGPGIGHDVMRRLDIAGVFALIVGTMPSFTRFSTAASNAGVHYSWPVQPPQRELCRGQFFSEALPSGVGIGLSQLFGCSRLVRCILLWKRYGYCFVKPLFWGGFA